MVSAALSSLPLTHPHVPHVHFISYYFFKSGAGHKDLADQLQSPLPQLVSRASLIFIISSLLHPF